MQKQPLYYIEVNILDRICYVTENDLRILYGLSGNVTGARKEFREIPEDACIVRVTWSNKKTLSDSREKISQLKRLKDRSEDAL